MRKWEYLTFDVSTLAGGYTTVIKINDEKKIPKREGLPTLFTLLNQLGGEGWEVTGVITSGIDALSGYSTVILKREISI